MEPRINDGDYCVFRMQPEGTREGKIVLARSRHISDPESGGSFTVKRYRSEKAMDPGGEWKHQRVILDPLNPDYESIVLTDETDGEVEVIAEYLSTLSKA